MTARMRLTALYTGLFLAAGSLLVAIVYSLVRADLPKTVIVKGIPDPKFLQACRQGQQKVPDPVFITKCKAAFAAGTKAGASVQRTQTLHDLLLYSLIALTVTTILAGVLGWFVAGRILRPVHAITAAARHASDRHLGERLALEGPRDELRELADTFDDMLDRLDRSFAAQKRFVANASHELRTPLTVMQTAIDIVLAKPNPHPDDYRAMTSTVKTSLTESEELIAALLTLARSDRGPERREPVDLAICCEDALDALLGTKPIVHADLEPALVDGDPVLLTRMCANLVDNATRYNVAGGTMHVRTETVDDEARLTVSNTGPEIQENEIDAIFEPFHRADGRAARHDGFGLGLSIVRAVAASHDGTASASAHPGGGLVVRVALPARAAIAPGSDAE
jgi:signal transduction histidine kinase